MVRSILLVDAVATQDTVTQPVASATETSRPVRPADGARDGARSNVSSGDCRAIPQIKAALPEVAKVRRDVLCVNMPGLPCRHHDAALIILRFTLALRSLAASKIDSRWSETP